MPSTSFYKHLFLEPAEFDFIIVGGGRCGTVVANRLSENPDFTTLLLEEGCDTSPLSSIPGLSSYTFFKNYTKIYKMKPQSNFGLGLKVIYFFTIKLYQPYQ